MRPANGQSKKFYNTSLIGKGYFLTVPSFMHVRKELLRLVTTKIYWRKIQKPIIKNSKTSSRIFYLPEAQPVHFFQLLTKKICVRSEKAGTWKFPLQRWDLR